MDPLAKDARLVAVDFETTGYVRGYPDQPWQIGLIEMRAGEVAPATAHDTLLNVGARPFNPHAPGRHGLLREELAAAPELASLWPELAPRLVGVPLVAHNAATEKRMLAHAFPMHTFGPWIDTLAIARAAYPTLKSHRLEEVLNALGLTPTVQALCPERTWHDALYDACASAVLLAHLVTLPGWATRTIHALADTRHPNAR